MFSIVCSFNAHFVFIFVEIFSRMPLNKKPFERLLRINDKFNQRKGSRAVVTSNELIEELGISRRQLMKDLEELRTLGAPLEYVASDRGYRYTDAFDFSDNIPLSADDVLQLRIAVELLAKVNHLEGFQRLPEVFEKIRRSIRRWVDRKATEKAIYFDPLPHYEGGVHLSFFLQAIEGSHQVKFQYQSFHAEECRTVIFDPYFLRHYDRRWYVGGFSHDPTERFVRVFPLERIKDTPEQIGYFHDKPKDYQPDNYWKNIYGITLPPGGLPEDVELWFSPAEAGYFLTTPFFEPFEVLSHTTGGLVVRIRLIPNRDLIRKLGSLGKEVKVIKPQKLAEDMRIFHNEAIRLYDRHH
jgi:predicted DNA-binding transcriptional regulator YafY